MQITILVGKEKFSFNLFRETKIEESGVGDEILNQPSSYGFLTMLHKQLLKGLADAKLAEKKAYASAYIKNKSQINSETNRPNSDDLAKQKSELDIKYLMAQKKTNEAQFDVNRIEACVRAFEQKKDMLQTLSANKRKEIN
jgi:hypothetical protein